MSPRAGRRALATLAGCCLLAACTTAAPPGAGTGRTPGATSPSRASAPPAAAAVDLVAGPVTVVVQPSVPLAAVGGTISTSHDEHDAHLTVSVPAGSASVRAATLVPGPGHRFELQPDGSVVVLDAAGHWVGGFFPDGTGASLSAAADGALTLTSSSQGRLWLSSLAVLSLQWGHKEGGRSLSVSPTPWARSGTRAAEAGVWAAISADPAADNASMRAQLDCHMLGAPDKATWNLEPWRPDVSAAQMIVTACNPT